MQKVHVDVKINADLKTVFEAISDHESFLSGGGLKCRLIKEGSIDRNGVGAIREVQAPKLTFIERITEFENLLRYSYLIESTKPSRPIKHHKGWLDFRFSDGVTHVNWHSHFDITIPLIGPLIGYFAKRQLSKVFLKRLEHTQETLES